MLQAVWLVCDERTSRPAVEKALRGWVSEGYGPTPTANPNVREIIAALVCAAVHRVVPLPGL